MNHVNEYRLFKGTSKPETRNSLIPPSADNPYYGVGYKKDVEQDPDEPFFSVNKKRYFNKKNDDVIKQQKELNNPIGISKMKEFGFTDEDIKKLETLGNINKPSYNKEDDTWWIWVTFKNSDYSVAFKYYLPEKDFVVTSPDYVDYKKHLKKRFDNASDAVNWVIEVRDTAKARRRESERATGERTYEANEPGVDVFGLKGIDKKLNNLIGFEDFDKFKPKEQKSTKRTDVGLDIVNEKRRR